MNQRLQQFLAAENISQAQFADSINVARASVSHVLAGRNNPGYDFIRSLSIHYPNLNLEWLINGKGKMYKTAAAVAVEEPIKLKKDDSQDSVFSDDIFSQDDIFQSGSFSLKPAPRVDAPIAAQTAAPATAVQVQAQPVQQASPVAAPAPAPAPVAAAAPKQRSISKIVIFYDDNTFQELK